MRRALSKKLVLPISCCMLVLSPTTLSLAADDARNYSRESSTESSSWSEYVSSYFLDNNSNNNSNNNNNKSHAASNFWRPKRGGEGGRLRRLFGRQQQQPRKEKRNFEIANGHDRLFRFNEANYYDDKNDVAYYNNNNAADDDAAANGDDANGDDAQQNMDDQSDNLCFKAFFNDSGNNDCQGYQTAYLDAYCDKLNSKYQNGDDDNDDYFKDYNYIACCQYLALQIETTCDDSEIITNLHLLLIASVLLLCEMAKSIIKKHNIHWIPEAGGCIIVGALVGFVSHLSKHNLDDLSFNEDLFLCILLPPIIFEAALEVNKYEFKRRRLAILMFAVVGTILSTFMTGYIVHYGSYYFSKDDDDKSGTIPLLDSFVFGALISSIDPVAILSVLSSINLTERDTVFIMVFGESLLNDGISITLFKTLIRHYENSEDAVEIDEILGTIADFVIVGFGSIFIGLVCGFAALIYFWFLRKKLTPSMEVGSFFLWAGIPYYICDECNLSGIVAIVTIGFFMDIYIAKPKDDIGSDGSASSTFLPRVTSSNPRDLKKPDGMMNLSTQMEMPPLREAANDHYVDLGDSVPCDPDNFCGVSPSGRSIYSLKTFRSLRTFNMRELILREERFRLTVEADKHVRFVAHLLASLSENSIFVYLGLFLYSKKYVWKVPIIIISIVSCIVSRTVMVTIVCNLVWYINILRQKCGCYKPTHIYLEQLKPGEPVVSRTASALQDPKIRLVLVLAGLRGAVSLALMESVPQYSAVTELGSQYKGEMKAMTSASIIFTIFIIGGSAYYIINKLEIATDADEPEIIRMPLVDRKSLRWTQYAPKPEAPMRKPQQYNNMPGIS